MSFNVGNIQSKFEASEKGFEEFLAEVDAEIDRASEPNHEEHLTAVLRAASELALYNKEVVLGQRAEMSTDVEYHPENQYDEAVQRLRVALGY